MGWWDELEQYELRDRVYINGEPYRLFEEWRQMKRQCMVRVGKDPMRSTQCVNEAAFSVNFGNGEAQDVCRDCLAVACDMLDEVMVKKLRQRPRPQMHRF